MLRDMIIRYLPNRLRRIAANKNEKKWIAGTYHRVHRGKHASFSLQI